MSEASVRPVKKSKSLIAKTTKELRPGDRHEMIASEAYYLAENRNFQGGDSMTDWLRAEAKIDRLYKGK